MNIQDFKENRRDIDTISKEKETICIVLDKAAVRLEYYAFKKCYELAVAVFADFNDVDTVKIEAYAQKEYFEDAILKSTSNKYSFSATRKDLTKFTEKYWEEALLGINKKQYIERVANQFITIQKL